MTFFEKIQKRSKSNRTNLCIGLDFPKFHEKFIEATADAAVCYKINPAFLKFDIPQIKSIASILKEKEIPWIYDGKIGDVLHSNEQYANFVYEEIEADAVTLQPYLGVAALHPFFNYKDKGNFVLCKTSNREAKHYQDALSNQIIEDIQSIDSAGLVVASDQIAEVKEKNPLSWILCPGIGHQGGVIEKTKNTIWNVSRSIFQSKNPGAIANFFANESYFDFFDTMEINDLIRHGNFTLSNGEESNIYLNAKGISKSPKLLNYIITSFLEHIPKRCNLVGLSTGGISYTSILGHALSLPFGYIRSETKEHGNQELLEGSLDRNLPIVLIDDIWTNGRSMMESYIELNNLGFSVIKVICLYNRDMAGSKERVEKFNQLLIDTVFIFED